MTPSPEAYFRLQLMTERAGMAPAEGLLTPLSGVGNGTDEVGLAHSLKAVSETDPKAMTSFGIITNEQVDRSKEVVLGDGIDWADFDRNPIGLFQHNRMAPVCKYVDPNTGRSTIERRGKEVYGRAYYIQKGPTQLVQMAEQVFQLVEAKILNGKSLGFLSHWKDHKRVPDDVNDPYAGGTTYIQKCRPFEISDVFFPDNPRALVTEVVRKGLGGKPLCLPIFKSLAPLADPEVAWAMGWGGPDSTTTTKEAPPVSTPAATETKRCSVCKKEMGDGDGDDKDVKTCKACGKMKALEEENAQLKAAAAQHKSLSVNADRLAFYEKNVSPRLGLPVSDYTGKLSQKVMKATYDGAMFLATNALATIDDVEGEAEKSLREFVTYTVHSAAGIAERYKEQFNAEIPGATPPDAILDACRNPEVSDPILKAMADACMAWTVHFKGWRKAHTDRTKSAAELLTALGNSATAPDDATRQKALLAAKHLAEMAAENGSLVVVEDLQVQEAVKGLQETVTKLEEEVAKNKKIISRARAGLSV